MREINLALWVLWNSSLAVIPVALGYAISGLAGPPGQRIRKRVMPLMLVMGFFWLIFLPNTCYLLSEWRHFLESVDYANLGFRWRTDSGAALALMIYTLFYLCFSGIGMLCFALAIRPIARVFRERGANLWVWGIPLFMLNSVGVYLGLILRFNSWEMISRPGRIWASVAVLADRPVLASFIIAFAAFLWVAYLIVDIWIDGFTARWRKWLMVDG